MLFIRTSFVINMIFKAVKPFIHEVTLAKFRFLGHEYENELFSLIDRSEVPKDYGGDGLSLDQI